MQSRSLESEGFRVTLGRDQGSCMIEGRSGLHERTVPECVVLGVRPDATPSAKPPVRIFLGTEASQFRPERVFVWSIEQVRDPGREYQIFLMKELAGFDRRRWTTGFTNYRFAIPHFAGGVGRAIYNDEDQIYLTDPGELFDLEMGDRGFLAISETESSVMLVDCARMAEVWPIEAAKFEAKKTLLKRAVEKGLFGSLAPGWNAREDEYEAGSSQLLHYTTLHTQPWRPFPDRFVYRENPLGELWHQLERSADRSRFQLFSRSRPSSRFKQARPEGLGDSAGCSETQELLNELEVRSVVRWEPACVDLERAAPASTGDAVVCCQGLEQVPEDDVPWLLDELFAAGDRFVVASVDCGRQIAQTATTTETTTAPGRWPDHFTAAGARHPGIRWQLVVQHSEPNGQDVCQYYRGGSRHDPNPPRVRLLVEPSSSFSESAESLAETLGWPWEHLGEEEQDAAPWPDLLLCAGSGVASRARGIRLRSRGRTRVVLLAEGAEPAAELDLVITPVSAGLFPDPRRFEIAVPLVATRTEERCRASEPWRKLFVEADAPRIALLVDGPRSGLTTALAERLGRAAAEAARLQGGSIFGLLSPKLSNSVTSALGAALGRSHLAVLERGDDPYLAHLELADAFIVTGDAEWILADVCFTGKPVDIFPLSERLGLLERLRGAVVRLADSSPTNNRGTARPQKGLERFCSRLIANGTVRPPKNRRALHDALVARGCARRLGDRALDPEFRPLREAERAAGQVQSLLGIG